MRTGRQQRVAVIGDSNLVCTAITFALRSRLDVVTYDVKRCGEIPPPEERTPEWDLIIVAIATENGEPIAELAEASLLKWIGRVPVLIVSTRAFDSCPEFGISHLRFPFQPDELCRRAGALLAPNGCAMVQEASG